MDVLTVLIFLKASGHFRSNFASYSSIFFLLITAKESYSSRVQLYQHTQQKLALDAIEEASKQSQKLCKCSKKLCNSATVSVVSNSGSWTLLHESLWKALLHYAWFHTFCIGRPTYRGTSAKTFGAANKSNS